MENVIYNARPPMFRARPVVFVIFLALAVTPPFVGVILLAFWWFFAKDQGLRMNEDYLLYIEGILSKRTHQVWYHDIKNTRTSQGLIDRMMNVGRISIIPAYGEEVVISVKDPSRVQRLINEHRVQKTSIRGER